MKTYKELIANLIAEYQAKVERCDEYISALVAEIRDYKNRGSEIPETFYETKKIQITARQCYIQFIADLEVLSC